MLDQSDKKGRLAIPRLVIAGLALLVVVILLAQNSERVELTLFFWNLTLPLWFALALMVLLGAGLGQAIGMGRGRKRDCPAAAAPGPPRASVRRTGAEHQATRRAR